jgi:UDPglucose 6-dehydrogenase
MKLCVIGTGYVGLVAGTCLADGGHNVICVDIEPEKIGKLQNGEVPIYEPGLEELLQRNAAEGRLTFTTNMAAAVRAAAVVFLAVGTPPRPDGAADLSFLLTAARAVGRAMNGPRIVVIKSTVPVGTAELVRTVIRRGTRQRVTVVSNPEFLKEGAAVEDFLKPDRIIIGTDSLPAIEVMKEIYSPFNRTRSRIVLMDNRSAEMTKYAANCLLATKISFINEMANFCQLAGADINRVREGLGSDSRIGYAFLFPGMGFGGSCFPKDIHALINLGKKYKFDFKVLKAVDAVNQGQKRVFMPAIKRHFRGRLKGKTIAVWGLAFKPRTDDMREAPALVLARELLRAGARIRAYDPAAMAEARKLLGSKVTYCVRSYEALEKADALVVVTEWNEFRRPDFQLMKRLMRCPVIFDGRNIYTPELMHKYGFIYHCIGQKREKKG